MVCNRIDTTWDIWCPVVSRNPLTGLSGLQHPVSAGCAWKAQSGRNPLTGLSGLQLPNEGEGMGEEEICRNPLAGLSGLQLLGEAEVIRHLGVKMSQSPYGAMWFATQVGLACARGSSGVAIPLRGYVVCNANASRVATPGEGLGSQSPYGAMWFATTAYDRVGDGFDRLSQSPYGAKWFATPLTLRASIRPLTSCRNPLTGLCGLQLYPPKNALLDSAAGGGGL